MDEFKRHGGLIVNEMKLSECLSVGAAGKVEGFVDLRSFTPDSQKHIPLDHGMVILFQLLTGSWHQITGSFCFQRKCKSCTAFEDCCGSHAAYTESRPQSGFYNVGWSLMESVHVA